MIRARLDEIDLGDLLRTLEAGRKNAVIEITCPKLKGRIHLREGRIAYIHTTPGTHLGEYLVRFDYLTLEQVQELVKFQQQENPGTPLGLLALQHRMVSESELTDALHTQILEGLATLLAQPEGELVAQTPPTDASQVLLPGVTDTSAILIEALRRLDEWMRGKVDPDTVLQLCGDPTRHALSPDAWTVLEAIDGLRRARSVALECDLPEEQVYHLLYELKSRGLLMEAEVHPQDPVLLVLCESGVTKRLLLITLERYRYRVMLPPDLEAARSILKHHRVQGVLLEGPNLAYKVRFLRALPGGRYLPIWIIAEQAPRGLWVRGARVAHIAKPFGEEDLLAALSIIKRPV